MGKHYFEKKGFVIGQGSSWFAGLCGCLLFPSAVSDIYPAEDHNQTAEEWLKRKFIELNSIDLFSCVSFIF